MCCTPQTDNKMLMKKQRQELAAAGAQAAYDAFKMREASRELDHVSHVLLCLSLQYKHARAGREEDRFVRTAGAQLSRPSTHACTN